MDLGRGEAEEGGWEVGEETINIKFHRIRLDVEGYFAAIKLEKQPI